MASLETIARSHGYANAEGFKQAEVAKQKTVREQRAVAEAFDYFVRYGNVSTTSVTTWTTTTLAQYLPTDGELSYATSYASNNSRRPWDEMAAHLKVINVWRDAKQKEFEAAAAKEPRPPSIPGRHRRDEWA